MDGELSILDPVVQYIFAALFVISLCAAAWFVHWLFKRLFKERDNDFKHIKERLATLPCDRHEEQLRQQEKLINGLREAE